MISVHLLGWVLIEMFASQVCITGENVYPLLLAVIHILSLKIKKAFNVVEQSQA